MPESRWGWAWTLKHRITFPLTHPRKWLCDKGFLCKTCHAVYVEDAEALGQIADIVYDVLSERNINSTVRVSGQGEYPEVWIGAAENALREIREIVEST